MAAFQSREKKAGRVCAKRNAERRRRKRKKKIPLRSRQASKSEYIYIYIAKGRERKDGRRGEKCAKVNLPFTRMIRGSSLEKRIIIRVSGEAGRTITLVKGGFVVKSVEFEFRSA